VAARRIILARPTRERTALQAMPETEETTQAVATYARALVMTPLLRQEHPSVPTNPLVARAMYLAGYIEEWGTGTLRVIEALRAGGNPEPTFAEATGGIRVVLPLPGTVPRDLHPRQVEWLRAKDRGAEFKTKAYATHFGVTGRTALADLNKLAQLGLVERRGVGPATIPRSAAAQRPWNPHNPRTQGCWVWRPRLP